MRYPNFYVSSRVVFSTGKRGAHSVAKSSRQTGIRGLLAIVRCRNHLLYGMRDPFLPPSAAERDAPLGQAMEAQASIMAEPFSH